MWVQLQVQVLVKDSHMLLPCHRLNAESSINCVMMAGCKYLTFAAVPAKKTFTEFQVFLFPILLFQNVFH
jgi:hypothetical protein